MQYETFSIVTEVRWKGNDKIRFRGEVSSSSCVSAVWGCSLRAGRDTSQVASRTEAVRRGADRAVTAHVAVFHHKHKLSLPSPPAAAVSRAVRSISSCSEDSRARLDIIYQPVIQGICCRYTEYWNDSVKSDIKSTKSSKQQFFSPSIV